MIWKNKLEEGLLSLNIIEEKTEFDIYFELLIDTSPSGLKASEIAEQVGIDRSYTYKFLKNLETKKLIISEKISSTAKTYRAIDPSLIVRSYYNEITEFVNFIDTEVKEKLQEYKTVKTAPLKQVFSIDSIFLLQKRIKETLPNVKFRIFIQATANFIETLNPELKERFLHLEGLKRENNGHYEFGIISVIQKTDDTKLTFSKAIARTQKHTHNIIVVLDHTTFVFNIHPDALIQPFGMGMMVIDQDISDSYSHQIDHMWKESLYESLPPAKKIDLFDSMKKDLNFVKSMEVLFNQGWKIFPFESSSEDNYLELIGPVRGSIAALRESGILFIPLSPNMPIDKVMKEVFESSKRELVKSIKKEEARESIEMEHEEKTEEMYGFICSSLITKIKFPDFDGVEIQQFKNDPGRMVVFNYYNRAVIMVWAVVGKNVETVLRTLHETEEA